MVKRLRAEQSAAQQLSLFESAQEVSSIVPTQEELALEWEPIWQRWTKNASHLSENDCAQIRSWLLAWGSQHNYPAFSFPFARNSPTDRRVGLLYGGEQRWKSDLHPPYTQREWYAGEWLLKAFEHVKRFDAGEISIPRPDEGRDEDEQD